MCEESVCYHSLIFVQALAVILVDGIDPFSGGFDYNTAMHAQDRHMIELVNNQNSISARLLMIAPEKVSVGSY